jgi:hypothetical protein
LGVVIYHITKIKTQLLNLSGELVADDLTEKEDVIKRVLGVVEHPDKNDVEVKEIIDTLAIKQRLK